MEVVGWWVDILKLTREERKLEKERALSTTTLVTVLTSSDSEARHNDFHHFSNPCTQIR